LHPDSLPLAGKLSADRSSGIGRIYR
jgi:hypothetical protein